MGLLGNEAEVRLLFDENNVRSFQAKGEEEEIISYFPIISSTVA
jgi:hypothetical protein